MRKKFAAYIHEREGKLFKESAHGFAIYSFPDDVHCWIRDIYTEPEFRQTGEAKLLADLIAAEAKQAGRTVLLGSVALNAPGVTISLKGLISYGMEYSHRVEELLIFKKEIT